MSERCLKLSNHRSEKCYNSADNVFQNTPVGDEEPKLLFDYLNSHDFSENSQKAIKQDIKKFAKWFSKSNKEPLNIHRITTRDISDFKNSMRRDGQAVSTVNRALVKEPCIVR